jgi:hypothetical protein
MAVNRWHNMVRLGCSETCMASGAALGNDSNTCEAREASYRRLGSGMVVSAQRVIADKTCWARGVLWGLSGWC